MDNMIDAVYSYTFLVVAVSQAQIVLSWIGMKGCRRLILVFSFEICLFVHMR
jgi:hypothetical protein